MIKKTLLTIGIVLFSYMSYAQIANDAAVSTKQNAEEIVVKDEGVKVFEGEIFKVVEEMPEFPGGAAKMMEFIQKNIQYPMTARENGIQGRVFVNFVIEPDGSITNVTAMRGIGGGCDEEAIRVVQSMPNWKPGKQRGVAVRTSFTVSVIFK
jgi:protein TonB